MRTERYKSFKQRRYEQSQKAWKEEIDYIKKQIRQVCDIYGTLAVKEAINEIDQEEKEAIASFPLEVN